MAAGQKRAGGLPTDRRHRFQRLDPDWELVDFVVRELPAAGGAAGSPHGDDDDGWELVAFLDPRRAK